MVADEYASPTEVLLKLYGFSIENSDIVFTRPSVTSKFEDNEILNIVPVMKFLGRIDSVTKIFNCTDEYLNYKVNQSISNKEADKEIKTVGLGGTPGKGKTTLAHRFLNEPYHGIFHDIINDCRNTNRRYRVSCTNFRTILDTETQLSLMILYESFKHSTSLGSIMEFIDKYYENYKNTILKLSSVLKLITECFRHESSDILRLIIINLDETNFFLKSKSEIDLNFFQLILRILHAAAVEFTVLSILSGTHSLELFDQIDNSIFKLYPVEISLLSLEHSKEIVQSMAKRKAVISPHLEFVLELCGGVGRYIEVVIMKMSQIAYFEMHNNATYSFHRDAFEHFLSNLQSESIYIQKLLDQVLTEVQNRYPQLFSNFLTLWNYWLVIRFFGGQLHEILY